MLWGKQRGARLSDAVDSLAHNSVASLKACKQKHLLTQLCDTLPSEDVQDDSWLPKLPAHRSKTLHPEPTMCSHIRLRPDTHSPTETTGLKLEN